MKKKYGIETNFKESLMKWKKRPPYMQFLRKAKKSLAGKMILLFMILVLPLNVMMVVITNFVVKSYENNISASYEYQLDLYTKTLQGQFTIMKKDMKEFLNINNLSILMQGSVDDSTMAMVHFSDTLSTSDIWDMYPGMFCIWDRNKDILTLNNNKKKYGIAIKQGISSQIKRNSGYVQGKHQYLSQSVVSFGNHAFLLQQYDYQYFSIGLMFDLEDIMNQYYTESREAVGQLYLVDGSDKIYATMNENGFKCTGNSGIDRNSLKKDNNLIVQQKVGFGEYSLLQIIPRSEYMKKMKMMQGVLYFLCGLSFFTIPLLWIVLRHYVIHPVKILCSGMEKIKEGDMEYQMECGTGSYQMDFLYLNFNHMVKELQIMITESYQKEIERLQTESINFRLQVNQHMLLNFLNTLYSLSRTGKKAELEEFTLLLMNYFQYVLRQDSELVTVKEEMQFVQEYLKLQKMRFPNSFNMVYSMDEETEDIMIPQLLIENFVENSIKHGLVMNREIEILINIRTCGDFVMISICDTGNGMSEEMAKKLQNGEIIEDLSGKHIGISNCRKRLKYYYGEMQEMHITSSINHGTQVWMKLRKEPLHKKDAAFLVRTMDIKKGEKEDELINCR